MWNFFKKKKVDNEKIKEFDSALKAINIFVVLSEWSKAKKWLEEIEYKEKESLNAVLKDLDTLDDKDKSILKKKDKLSKEFQKKQKRLNKLREDVEKKEEKYNIKVEKERFKIRFKKVKDEIESLVWNKKNDQALWLLKNFLSENADNSSVIRFYNKQKAKILKSKEKVKKENEEKVKNNARLEAMNLIWETANIKENKEENEKEKSFFESIKSHVNFYKTLKEKIKKKKLLDEINLLIEEDSKIKNDLAARKLANIHKWLVKELANNKIVWYELYWKILWADKISGDTFWFVEDDDKYNFFLWDATWHGIRAWFIITLLSRLFNKYVKKSDLRGLTYEINNGLKQDLKSRNFITAIFFEVFKDDVSKIKFVWMWHEPILIYRKQLGKVEKVIPWGLAAWIRLINKPTDIKIKELELNDGDILLTYSDWIVENKNSEWEFYWMDRLEHALQTIWKSNAEITKIYDYIINDIKLFRGWAQFDDDVSALILKRENKKDIVDEHSEYLEKIKTKEWLKTSELKKLKWKSKEEIDKQIEEIKKEKETKRIIKNLEGLYYTWEILKLKQEAIRHIRDWYIDKKINYYLKKAIDNETAYKVEQKNQKITSKYHILDELFTKWDYDTVISEIEEIISKDWNI